MTDRDQRLQVKRYRVRRRKHGTCSVCTFRELTDGRFHCRKWPDRQGSCDTDGKLPKFQFDETVMTDLRGS
ncbi:hypothetical protein [Lysobacter sp. F6437]|uniref:hypothetical protein n=1 Tax=Lysobacter sp. F6437 TaxID=3459296 RepID=UPI00403E0F85